MIFPNYALMEWPVIFSRLFQDGVIVENMHDVPYMHAHTLQPETTAVMTRACLVCAETVKQKRSRMALGVQVLAGGNLQAMAVAHAAGQLEEHDCYFFILAILALY